MWIKIPHKYTLTYIKIKLEINVHTFPSLLHLPQLIYKYTVLILLENSCGCEIERKREKERDFMLIYKKSEKKTGGKNYYKKNKTESLAFNGSRRD